jgi:putative peptidoglycan lipid II flippase
MLPYMPLVCLVAVLGAMLQVHGRFGPTAAAPVILNLLIVAATLGLRPLFPEEGVLHVGLVGGAVVLAGVIQVAWSLWALRGVEWWVRDRAAKREARPAFRGVLSKAWPMILGLGVLQVNTFLDGLIASYPATFGDTFFGRKYPLEQGAMAALSYAQRLYEFPLGVFGIAVATAIFPALSRVANDAEPFGDVLRRGLRLVVYIGLPASAGLILVREPLTAAVYKGGDFTAEDTRRVAFILMGYAPAIWAYSMTHVLTRAFYARGDSRTPVRVSLAMVGLNLVLNIALINTPLKEAGLAWSTAICAMLQVVIMMNLVRRHAARPVDHAVRMGWLRSVAVTALMIAAVWLADGLLRDASGEALTWWWAILRLAALVIAGGGVVILASLALRMPELKWALGRP